MNYGEYLELFSAVVIILTKPDKTLQKLQVLLCIRYQKELVNKYNGLTLYIALNMLHVL